MVFWLNLSHIVQLERIFKKFKLLLLLLTEIYTLLCLLANQENTPRASLRHLHVRIIPFRVFSEPNMFKYFPRIRRRFCVPQITLICHILHLRLNTFCVFSEYAQILSAQSPQVPKSFPRILQLRRKNEECAERNFSFQQCLGTLKGQYFKKTEWGVICLLRRNSLKIKFFGYL